MLGAAGLRVDDRSRHRGPLNRAASFYFAGSVLRDEKMNRIPLGRSFQLASIQITGEFFTVPLQPQNQIERRAIEVRTENPSAVDGTRGLSCRSLENFRLDVRRFEQAREENEQEESKFAHGCLRKESDQQIVTNGRPV